jgi:hypothetical protein
MGLRELAGDMARNTSGLWRGIADAVDPDGRHPTAAAGDGSSTYESPAGPAAGTADGFEEHGGKMIVPLDTWTRILEQVGNVHEAGQQLAEARERAARAETENRFLHEQIKDLKTQGRPARRSAAKPAVTADPTPAESVPSPPRDSRPIRARRRLSNWVSPSR